MPSNTTPATATVIASLPFSESVDIAGTGSGTGYTPTCVGSEPRATWYKFTTGPEDFCISCSAKCNPGFAVLSFWTGTPPALTEWSKLNDSATPVEFCAGGNDLNEWLMVPLDANTDYYIQVNVTADPSENLQFEIRGNPNLAAPLSSSYLFNDDTDLYPALVYSSVTGALLNIRNLPSGESGARATSGVMCVNMSHFTDSVRVLDTDYTTIADVFILAGNNFIPVTTDGTFFYTAIESGGAINITKIDSAGVVQDTWAVASALGVFGLACDGSILYFIEGGFNKPISRIDLSGAGSVLSNLHAGFPGEKCETFGDGVIDGSTVWFGYQSGTTVNLRQFDLSTGSVLDTISYTGSCNHFIRVGETFVVQGFTGGGDIIIVTVDIGSGTVIFTNTVPFRNDIGQVVGTPNGPFGLSVSCYLLGVTAEPAPTPKSIIWPVWLNDGTWVIFTGTYLGNGTSQRYDLDGNLIKEFTYNHDDFQGGMYNQTALLAQNSCLVGSPGLIWLAGHHTAPASIIQPGIQAIDIETGALFPIVDVVSAPPEVDISAGLTTFEYSSSDGEPTDQGLPPKPTVSCGPLSNLKTPTPNRGCNTCGLGSTPTYTGPSGVVPDADDPIGEATLTGKRDIVIWIEIVHTQYHDDDTETVETLRYGFVEPPVAPHREGRLVAAGTLEQASSDGQGQMKSTSADIAIFDAPGRPIATRRADRTRLNFNRDEMTAFAISEAELVAGGTPKMIGRVLLYGDSSGTPLTASLHGVDHLFIEGGSFSPDKTMPMFRYPLGYYTNAPSDLANFFMPVIYGEVTDHGATNPTTGELDECGKCTPRMVDPVSTLFGEVYGRFNNNLYASYLIDDVFGSDCGGLGCWGMYAVSDGKGPNSNIGLGGRGDFTKIPGGGWAQLILWSKELGRTEHRILKVNIAAQSVRVEGQLDPKIINGPVDWMIERIDHAPRRVKIDIADRQGFDVMIPGYAGYTRSTTYEDFTDPTDGRKWRVTDFGIRGPLLQEHMGGGPTIATNTIGVEDKGDGTGLPIVDAFQAYCHWWDNCVHQQRTTPPINDNLWAQTQADLPQWSDGLTKTMQTSFVACQDLTARSLGGYGLRIGIVFDEGVSLRDACQLWNDNLGCRTVNEEHGRVKVWMVDKYADVSTWPRLDHAPRVFGSVETPRAADEAMNVIRCGFDWDPDNRTFRRDNVAIKSAPAIRRNKRYEKPSKHYDFKMLTLETFATWRMDNVLAANQDGPIYVPIEQCDLGVFDFPIGTGIVFTSIMGPGAEGYIDHPVMVLDRRTDLDQRTVTLQALDVGTAYTSQIIPVTQRFIATNNDSIAPIASNDPNLAPMAVA